MKMFLKSIFLSLSLVLAASVTFAQTKKTTTTKSATSTTKKATTTTKKVTSTKKATPVKTTSATHKPATNNFTINSTTISNTVGAVSTVLSQDDIAKGLKEALNIGVRNAATQLNKTDGYFGNALVKIPFPTEVSFVAAKVREYGMGSLVDEFEKSLNRAAENAAIEAAPIFANAITSITFNDAKNILLNGDGAATTYLKTATYSPLKNAFSPIINKSLTNLGVTDKWTYIINYYNQIPFIEKVNPNLAEYTTGKALDGLFLVVAQEENKIRKDANFQITDLLKQVFGQSTTTK